MSEWVIKIQVELTGMETEGGERMYGIPDSEGYKGPDFRDVYEPYIVELGWPSGDMGESVKTDSLEHFLRRSGEPLESYLTALRGVGGELLHAYGLDPSCLNYDDFLGRMLRNGCFLLEFIYTIKDIRSRSTRDTINSRIKHILENREEMERCVHDILLLGNQTPLIVLEKLHCLWTGDDQNKFLKVIAATFILRNGISVPNIECMDNELRWSMHILDVYRRILVHPEFKRDIPPIKKKRKQAEFVSTTIPTASDLHNIGIDFATSDSTSLLDISFQPDTLKLPKIVVDGSTKSIFLNLIAFEQLHKNIRRKEVNEYMYLMGYLIQAADDASLLQSCGIIVTTLPPYEVTILFRRMSKVISLDPSHLDQEYTEMLRMVRSRFNKLSNAWRKDLFQTYLKSPWAVMSVMVAMLLFTLSFIQTVYTVLSYVRPK